MQNRIFRLILFLFSIPYWFVTEIRNYIYDQGLKKSYSFGIPIISVGNLTVGGTGKTPLVEYLIRLFIKKNLPITTLSRGYGRKTRGLLFAGDAEDAARLGDEPCQVHKKYGKKINVVVSEDRVLAIRSIMNRSGRVPIVLDDAYQQRRIVPTFNILLTDFNKPFYSDYLLPAGRLREARKRAVRAQAVIVTKCPKNLLIKKKENIRRQIIKYSGEKPIFFSRVQYGEIKPIGQSPSMQDSKTIVLLSGIASPRLFENHLKERFEILKHFIYPDHYPYIPAHLYQIKQYLGNRVRSVPLLTTEKDMVKLIDSKFKTVFSDWSCYYLPIEMVFDEQGDTFDTLVMESMQGHHGGDVEINPLSP